MKRRCSTTLLRDDDVADPSDAPFDAVVVLMMENRSFDHLLGWLPGANGRQRGLAFVLEGRSLSAGRWSRRGGWTTW